MEYKTKTQLQSHYFIVAYSTYYEAYSMFRLVNNLTGEIKDLAAYELYHLLTSVDSQIKVNYVTWDWNKDTFKFKGQDISRVCILGPNSEPICNASGLVVTSIQGDNACVANWKGQILQAHQLQIANNVRAKKYILTNADVQANGRITMH